TPAKESGDVVAALEGHPGEDLMAVTSGGKMVRVKLDAVPAAGRAGAAEKAVGITGNERIATVTYVAERELPATPGGDGPPPAGDIVVVEDTDGGAPVDDGDADAPPAASADAPEPSSNGGGPDTPAAGGTAELDLFG
ncbi:MAG TPA: DNA gyrase C-terminal beta-propeller domain-containing protein, partial [Longimicrobium sp.]